MTSIERLSVAGLMALSTGLGVTGAVYVRPLLPAQQTPIQAEIVPFVPAPPPPVRTVSWFKAHPPEMHGKIEVCRDNPGEGRNDPECLNAEEASSKLSMERQLAEARAHGMFK